MRVAGVTLFFFGLFVEELPFTLDHIRDLRHHVFAIIYERFFEVLLHLVRHQVGVQEEWPLAVFLDVDSFLLGRVASRL
jgi:hypothetical protein